MVWVGRWPAPPMIVGSSSASVSARSNTRSMLVNTGKDGLTRLSEDYTDFYEESQGGFTPLLFAVRQGDVECAKLLLDAGTPVSDIVRTGVDFGTRYRDGGWGAGLTVLTAMANVAPHLDPADRALALVHGLAFTSRDTLGRAAASR